MPQAKRKGRATDPELMTTKEAKERYARENRRRAAGVLGVLMQGYGARSEGNETALNDLLTDIRHFCDAQKLDFAEIDGHARDHYLSELQQARTGVPQ